MKDKDQALLPHEPLLDIKFPRPLVERGYCWEGAFYDLDEAESMSGTITRDCDSGVFEYPFAKMDSMDFLLDRQRNLFKVAVYYNADQSVITQITRDAKMSVSDKISWVGGMAGLFTGFSVISGFEILYWLWFKVILHKKDNKVDHKEDTGDVTDEENIDDVKINVEKLMAQVEELTIKMKAAQAGEEKVGMAFDAIFNDPAATPKKPWSTSMSSMDSMFN